MTEQTTQHWEPSEMMRKLAAWEDPYGDGPGDSKHIELQRGEASRMVAEFDRLRAIESAAGAVPDTGHQAADVNEPAEALYTALHRLAYAWETDTTIKEMWAEWQRAKDAMAAYREVRASASGDTGQEAGDA